MSKKNRIPEPKIPNNKIKFSFEFYDTSCKYCLSNWGEGKIAAALGRLQDINSKTFDDLRRESVVYHFNSVDWSKTIERSGFPLAVANELEPFHFSLLGVNGQKARVFGAYSQGTFYIVWFDLNHVIWPTLLKNT